MDPGELRRRQATAGHVRRHAAPDGPATIPACPLGPVAYPDQDPDQGDHPVALGDGTWLTLAADGTTLNRWAPHRR
ncbi:hypothetical protein OG937_43180 [Streptomyces sp. NBC_00510]